MKQWWKETVFYQIYMPSFCDGNEDGIGDFRGIQSKLSYLKKLGIGCIWLTPFYPSPKVDQGYDISDYFDVDPDYGTMEDFDFFIEEAHKLGIRVISDVVINHTSTEHEWFKESKSSKNNSKRDWYIWKESKDGKEPNNWESFFGEKAWEYDTATEMYYYHSFAKEQVDLNWANAEVKKAIFEMLDFWVDKGLDGFRLDVINNLTLTDCFEDNPYDEKGKQIHKNDVNQSGIHDFMCELKEHLSTKKELFLVGEISSDIVEQIYSYVGDGQLDTTFNFNLGSIEKFDFNKFYGELEKMTKLYTGQNYPTIFFGSHDMPRFPTRFQFNENQVKNLFTLMMSYRGIPFIYNGDEIGMENYICHSKEDARDIQGIIAYEQAITEGKKEEAIEILNLKSRDHSRNTMYWNDSTYGGFSETAPWINYQKQPGSSAEEQLINQRSLFNYISKLIKERTSLKILSGGDCNVESPSEGVIICKRTDAVYTLWSIINFLDNEFIVELDCADGAEVSVLIETNENGVSIEENHVKVRAEHGGMILWMNK